VKTLVIDASVAVKWVVEEEGTTEGSLSGLWSLSSLRDDRHQRDDRSAAGGVPRFEASTSRYQCLDCVARSRSRAPSSGQTLPTARSWFRMGILHFLGLLRCLLLRSKLLLFCDLCVSFAAIQFGVTGVTARCRRYRRCRALPALPALLTRQAS
jgi:hypothetical protein